MRQSWKFHVIAVSIICGIILLLYVFIGPGGQKVQHIQQKTDRFIQVYSATWGMNCNPYIQRENEQRQQMRLRPGLVEEFAPDERPDSTDPLPLVTADNVLTEVGSRCNGQITCSFEVNSETLKVEPLKSCYKHLTVGYRCFAFDRLWTLNANQNETLTIDCHASDAETAQ